MKKAIILFIVVAITAISSCKKPAGEGGNSTITGKVHVTEWNGIFTVSTGEYMGADIDVYIIYGDDLSFGDRTRTGPDGVFEFKYLRKGSYKLYVYSKDKDAYLAGNSNPPNKAVYATATISEKKELVSVGTLEIIN